MAIVTGYMEHGLSPAPNFELTRTLNLGLLRLETIPERRGSLLLRPRSEYSRKHLFTLVFSQSGPHVYNSTPHLLNLLGRRPYCR